MYILFYILCLVPHSVDTLWTVDFSTPATGWIAGSQWQWLDESVFLDIACGSTSSGYYSNEDSLVSPLFIVPASADSLVLVFDHYWWGHGWCNTISEWAKSTSTLYMYSSSSGGQSQVLWEIVGFVEEDICLFRPGFTVVDSGYVSVPILNANPSDSLTFVFTGLVETYVYYMSAWADIEWNLYSFSILNYQSVTLERSTWGAIKATF